MRQLAEIGEELQRFADMTSKVLQIDMEIVDRRLVRVAGTGSYRPLVGLRLTERGVVNQTFFEHPGESLVLAHPGNDERCSSCRRYLNCPWKRALYYPLKIGREVLGVVGFVAGDEGQERFLKENQEFLMDYIGITAEALTNKIKIQRLSDQLNMRLRRRAGGAPAEEKVAETKKGGAGRDLFAEIRSRDKGFLTFKDRVRRLAALPSTILLNGETGAGKELFARAIHEASSRFGGPFVAVNCGAVPDSLIESELFGYEKGAFTGASSAGRRGRFLQADGGTLFLDELENMPVYLQQKLLRVLESREVERLGSQSPVPVDVRVVAATNRDLEALVKAGDFREDLYHRLNVIALNIPPLRERGDDCVYLAGCFAEEFGCLFGRGEMAVDESARQAIIGYSWPGNVRELKNAMEYAVSAAEGNVITVADLPERILRPALDAAENSLEASEAIQIRQALIRFGWSSEGKDAAAKFLGISRATIYRKIRKYGLTPG